MPPNSFADPNSKFLTIIFTIALVLLFNGAPEGWVLLWGAIPTGIAYLLGWLDDDHYPLVWRIFDWSDDKINGWRDDHRLYEVEVEKP